MIERSSEGEGGDAPPAETEAEPALRLGPSSYLVLGFVAETGPCTPYDLKRAVAKSIAYFWAFPHSQLYVEPGRLAKHGLLHETQEDRGRRRRLFSITDAGRAALRDWLEAPSHQQTEVRDLGLLKLYFASLTNPERVQQMAKEQIALHRERMAEYDEFAEAMARYPRQQPHQVPIRMGYLFEQAWVTFWTSILEDPPELSPSRRLPPPDGAIDAR